MVIRRVEPMSLAKLGLVIYAVIGLLIGGFFSLFGFLAGGLAQMGGGGEEGFPPMIGMMFGVGAIVIAPIFYGVMGFIGGYLVAVIFNVASGWIGGLQVDVQ
jgi:hypothetical protein